MPHWLLKAIPQKMLSILPGGATIHSWSQRRLMHSLEITDFFLQDRLEHAARHWTAWKQFGQADKAPVCLEIGTGWYPIVPIGMWLCGANRIYTSDVNPHLRPVLLEKLFTALSEAEQSGFLRQYLPDYQQGRWDQFNQWIQQQGPLEVLQLMDIQLLKSQPGTLPDPGQPIDLIHSNNTFEHIPVAQIPSLLQACYDRLAPAGINSHYIDLTDHYSYFDSHLSPLHYLRFGERAWGLIENRFQSQNRLRHAQWQALFAEARFQVLATETESGVAEDLEGFTVAKPFDVFEEEDLLVRYVGMVAGK